MIWKYTVLLLLILVSIRGRLSLAKPTADTNIDDNTIEDESENVRIQYAAQMLSYMNLSVQPCDDFYEYACGNWKHTIPERLTTKQRVNFLEINFQLTDIVEQMLQRSDVLNIAPDLEPEFQMAKQFYKNCLSSDLYPLSKSTEYLKVLQDIGGFPAVNSQWDDSQFSWFNMSAHLCNYGIIGFINEVIDTQYPFQPYFPLPTFGFDMELHNDTISNVTSKAYQINSKRMLSLMSLYKVDKDKSEKVIADVFQFLTAVLDMIAEFDEEQVMCEQLSESSSEDEFDLLSQQFIAYFDIAWKSKFEEVPADHMPCIYFYQELNKICEEHKEAVANYLSMKFLFHMDARLEDAKFQKEYCTTEIRQHLYILFDELFMKEHTSQEIADDVISMSKEIRSSLRELLNAADWMDEATREAALLKESAMKISVFRYEDHETHKTLLAQLKKLKYVEDNYEVNNMNLKKFSVYLQRYYGLHDEDFNNQTKPLPCLKAMEANAFFYMDDNTIYVAAGALLPPVYHKHWPNSLKWGTMGYTLGHEIGHGFDTKGRNFDSQGHQNNWWSNKTLNIFEERANCYVDHYSNYTMKEINRQVNGLLTNCENLADATGLVTAYKAYRRQANRQSETIRKEEQMPGLDLSSDQLFFLGAAQLWCSDYKEAHYWTQLTDYHTVEKYRVQGMLTNNIDFAKAYHCTVGDNMHPSEEKCSMW